MSDFMEYAEYYKKAWENSLKERTSEMQSEIKTLRAENTRLTKALENIACGDIPVGVARQDTPYSRWYEDYADAVLRGAK